MIQINRNPTRSELRTFGLLCAAFFALVGFSVLRKTHSMNAAEVVWVAGALFVATYFALPAIRKSIYVGWMYAAYPIGWTVSHLLLALVFFGVIVPIGLLMRLIRRDPLQKDFDPAAATYWLPHNPSPDPDRYFRQF